MPEQDTVKVEIELPKDQVHIIPTAESQTDSGPKRVTVSAHDRKVEKFKKQIAEASENAEQAKTNAPTGSALPKSVDEISRKDISPPNPSQKRIIAVGLAIALIGLILWPLVNFWLAIAVAIVGSAVVATATFVKI